MNSSTFLRSLAVLTFALGPACDPSDPPPEAPAGSSTTDAPAGSSGSETSEPSTSSGASTTGVSTTGTGGPIPGSCGDATTQKACEALGDEYFGCGWFATTVIADPTTCAPTGTQGVCLVTDQLDGCDELFADDACADVDGGWFWRSRDDGGIELMPQPLSCGGAGDFDPCPWHQDAVEGVDPAADAACACACAIAAP